MNICPHLGLQQDPKTPAIFPTGHNRCYHLRAARAVLDTHQQQYCLSKAHLSCPVFIDPAAASQSDFLYKPEALSRPSRVFPFLLLLLVFLGAALAAWHYREALFAAERIAQPPSPGPIASPAPLELQATPGVSEPLAAMLATSTPSPQPTHTPAPPTETATVTPPPGLGMPIGSNPALVIHRVVSGESLTTISALYRTSGEAIRAVNLMLPVPLWENWLVVVPFQTEEVAHLPLFEVYQVNVEGLTVASLARQLNLDAASLAKYNHLEQDDFFANGQWVLLPHARP